MSFVINSGTVTGRITKDADVRTTNSGKTIAKFSIATNRSKKNLDGEWEELTSFFNVDAFVPAKFAELLTKGKAVVVEYELRQDRWQTDSGENRQKVSLFGKNVLLMGGKSESAEPKTEYQQVNYQQPPQQPDMSGQLRDKEVPF